MAVSKLKIKNDIKRLKTDKKFVANLREKSAKEHKEHKTKKDPIAHAAKMGSKSPKSMFKESMGKLHKLSNKKSAK